MTGFSPQGKTISTCTLLKSGSSNADHGFHRLFKYLMFA